MPDINLLPDELRKKDEKELKSVQKKPKSFKIEMTSPNKEKTESPPKAIKPSFFRRFFSRGTKPVKPKKQEAIKEESRNNDFHIPEVKASDAGPKFDLDPNKFISREDDALLLSGEKLDPKTKKDREDISKPKKERFHLFGRAKPKKDFSEKNKDKDKWQKTRPEKVEEPKGPVAEKPEDKKKKGSILDVNLIPRDLMGDPELELPRKIFISGTIVLFFIILVIGSYLGITWYQIRIAKQIGRVEKEINVLAGDIARYEEKSRSALGLQKRLELVRQLLANHVYWTNFFELLEKYTISEVYYSDFSMVGHDKLVIFAVGRDYESVAKQLVAFQQAKDFVKEVRVDAASAEINEEFSNYLGVSFNINLEFVPGIFLKPIE